MAMSMMSSIGRRLDESRSNVERVVKEGLADLSPLAIGVVLVAPVVAAAIFFVWTHVATVQLGYLLSEEAETHHTLLETNRGLRIEVAAKKAPKRLEALAKDKYNLAPPTPRQIVRISDKRRPR